MAFIEKELEKKTLAEIGALIQGYEQNIMGIADKIRSGQAKPTDMLALNSELALLKKIRDKKVGEQERRIPRSQPKTSEPLKSYEDFLKNKETPKK